MPNTVIAWDSCIVIDAIERDTTKYQSIEPMVLKAQGGDLKIVVSTACIAEILYLRKMAEAGMPQADQNDLIERWLDNHFIVKRAVDRRIANKAAELRRQHDKLAGMDAIILATAILHSAEALITYDEGKSDGTNVGLLKLDGKLGLNAPRICRPEQFEKQPQLGLSPPPPVDTK